MGIRNRISQPPSPLAVARATLAVKAQNGQAAWAGSILSPNGRGSNKSGISVLIKKRRLNNGNAS